MVSIGIQEDSHETDIDTASYPKYRTAFLDCEVTDLVARELLSVGFLAGDGQELYIELTGAVHLVNASTFVLDTMITKFGLVGRPYH